MKQLDSAKLNPLRARWPLIFVVSTVAMMASPLLVDTLVSPYNMHLAYGIMAGLTVLFLTAYRIRRVLFRRPLGSMEAWLQAHIYLGILVVGFVLLHIRFTVGSLFGWLMVGLFAMVIASGIVGAILYQIIPAWLSRYGMDELWLDEYYKSPDVYQAEAEELVVGPQSSETFGQFYANHIASLFASRPASLRYFVATERNVIDRSKETFDAFLPLVPAADRGTLNMVRSIYLERERMAFKWSRLQMMRIWQYGHGPVNAAFLTTLLIHLYLITYF